MTSVIQARTVVANKSELHRALRANQVRVPDLRARISTDAFLVGVFQEEIYCPISGDPQFDCVRPPCLKELQ